MVAMKDRLRVSEPGVAARVIDGEAILINLTNGLYYSLAGSGASIWSLIEDGHSLEAIATALAGLSGVSLDRVRRDVRRLASELLEEELVRVADEDPSPPVEPPEARMPGAYEAPRLVKYDDMAKILVADPPLPRFLEASPCGPADNSE